ncbi:MAG: hypothetical protein ACOYO1_07350 [Bacteroidales bacterium]
MKNVSKKNQVALDIARLSGVTIYLPEFSDLNKKLDIVIKNVNDKKIDSKINQNLLQNLISCQQQLNFYIKCEKITVSKTRQKIYYKKSDIDNFINTKL